ncbi:MAG TPA: pyridoxal phosphate-dependent aminotransferase [Candidatus Saccharimonadales bacterium]|jgi:alanine-synthesizing transaminase|nr:pyridoxal phosphate-dependent aminotransferase [Candidatus Saccharimonadales bacterium]
MFSIRTNWDRTTNLLSEALARHRAAGRPLIDLSASNPTECSFDYDNYAIIRALCAPGVLRYHPDPCGLPMARSAVAGYYVAHGGQIAIEDMVLTTSTSEGYSFVFRLLCNPGDELLIPSPSYPLFDFLAGLQDVSLKPYPLVYDHGWQIDFHALEQAITSRTRGVIVVHPNNPTGHFTKASELAALNRICQSHDLALIADEVFLDFPLGNDTGGREKPFSFSANQAAPTFTLSGLSKISGLPQMKLAWLVVSGPESWKREALARLEVIADTYLSMNAPVQLAAPVLLEQRHRFQKQLLERVRRNLDELDRQLSTQKHCNRLHVEGGWYAVLRIPAIRSDEDFALELLEKHDVYLHPGHFYDFHREGHMVVSLITPEKDFLVGVRRAIESF